MKIYDNKNIIPHFIFVCIMSLVSFSVGAIESDNDIDKNTETETKKDEPRFVFGVGAAAVRFDSNFKVTDKQTGRSVFVDPEGDLGLPEVAHVNTLYGGYRFAENHQVEFGFFGIKRETSIFALDLNFNDVILVQGSAKLKDETDFYLLTYGYAIFKDDRSRINATFGIYGLDLKLAFEAEGDLTINGVTQSGVYRETVSVFAPLPLLGLDFNFSFTPRWSMRTKFALVGGSYEDISAGIFTSTINAHYKFSKHVGGVLGVTYFDATVDIDDGKTLNEVTYGYSGVYAGMHFIF
jgi:hypothetical protein